MQSSLLLLHLDCSAVLQPLSLILVTLQMVPTTLFFCVLHFDEQTNGVIILRLNGDQSPTHVEVKCVWAVPLI